MALDPTPLVLSLSGLASSLSIASSLRNLMKIDSVTAEEALEKLKRTASPDIQIALSDPLLVSSASEALIIDEDLLKQLTEEAQAALTNHISARKAAETAPPDKRRQLRQKAEDDAITEMCHILKSIKRFNNNRLPRQGSYKQWWKSNGCFD